MGLESVVVIEHSYPAQMSVEMAENWAVAPEQLADAAPAKILPADLTRAGYGIVFIVDESVNPTGTIKDRIAASLVNFYKQFSRELLRKNKPEEIAQKRIPRFSAITSGNLGLALAHAAEEYNLPPFKLLIHHELPSGRLVSLSKLKVDIYLTDLAKKPLTPEEIKYLTHNNDGYDLTSIRSPHYLNLVTECMAAKPDEIYVPYGSGELFESFLAAHSPTISILGAEPKDAHSVADKLIKNFNPFKKYDAKLIAALKKTGAIGPYTGVSLVSERSISTAYEMMRKYCPVEPSAAAGMALYIERCEEGLVGKHRKIMIINTGKGL